MATGAIKGAEGEKLRPPAAWATTPSTKDPTRDDGLRVLMGPFTVYNKDNVEKEAGPQPAGNVVKAKPGKAVTMVLLPKFLGILSFDQAHDGAEEAAKELQNPDDAAVPRPHAGEQRRRPDRDRDQRHHPGRGRHHDLQQRRRSDRAGGQGGPRRRA